MTQPQYPEPVDDPYLTAVLPIIEKPRCDCEYVDIGVGHQRVTDEPMCPQHSAFGLASAVLGALAEAKLLVPFGANGVVVHPWSAGNSDHLRVCLDHPDGPCRWSVAFPGQPTNRVPLLQLLDEIRDHDAHCIANAEVIP